MSKIKRNWEFDLDAVSKSRDQWRKLYVEANQDRESLLAWKQQAMVDMERLADHHHERCQLKAQLATAREALVAAEAAMNHMGEVINGMDAVEEEDEKFFPAFKLVKAALAAISQPKEGDTQ